MKRISLFILLLAVILPLHAERYAFGRGQLWVNPLAPNAVRIRYSETGLPASTPLADLLGDPAYLGQTQKFKYKQKRLSDGSLMLETSRMRLIANPATGRIDITNAEGRTVFSALSHQLQASTIQDEPTAIASLSIASPAAECLYGLGQFQDGYTDIRGLSRRLTQVNTQISIPMFLSSRGYGLLWNNYGLTEFNPCSEQVRLLRDEGEGKKEYVDITTTEGGRREERVQGAFTARFRVPCDGRYALLLDVGQQMARRHQLSIDGEQVLDARNLWLPPTASTIVTLKAGEHTVSAELERGDRPTLSWRLIDETTTLRSPVSEAVDYTVFVGNADEVMASLHDLTGHSPLMPRWALGYIHCRERFHSQQEILDVAHRFRKEQLPVDLLVQDWQYWGRYGWNAMQFDEQFYPNPRQLTDSLHAMGMRLMLSVWSKIDAKCEVGRYMGQHDYYIPGTDWIDFFNPSAASAYWQQFRQRLLPLGIDAWWQDATEPENDDLAGRRVGQGRKLAGERVRNVYPLMVNRTVYEGNRADRPGQRTMILTRCGFTGIQRYGAAMWSGDVGNDWTTLRRQITAGLGMMAAGQPWWTYDAGGFFRPSNQYTDPAYIERMLRWIQTSTYLPLMRVHGYMSDTEPWRYGEEAQRIIAQSLHERYRLLPYIYSLAARLHESGSMLMRPLVFDFPTDREALRQPTEFMLGPALLVCPVTEGGVSSWQVYLPQTEGGWTDCRTGKRYDGGQYIQMAVDKTFIPVFARSGSILPLAGDTLAITPGRDAQFSLYEDDGVSYDYEQGQSSHIPLQWDDARRTLRIGRRQGSFRGMSATRQFTATLPDGTRRTVTYSGKAQSIRF